MSIKYRLQCHSLELFGIWPLEIVAALRSAPIDHEHAFDYQHSRQRTACTSPLERFEGPNSTRHREALLPTPPIRFMANRLRQPPPDTGHSEQLQRSLLAIRCFNLCTNASHDQCNRVPVLSLLIAVRAHLVNSFLPQPSVINNVGQYA